MKIHPRFIKTNCYINIQSINIPDFADMEVLLSPGLFVIAE